MKHSRQRNEDIPTQHLKSKNKEKIDTDNVDIPDKHTIPRLAPKETETDRIRGYIDWFQGVLTHITVNCGVTIAKAVQEEKQDVVWKCGRISSIFRLPLLRQ